MNSVYTSQVMRLCGYVAMPVHSFASNPYGGTQHPMEPPLAPEGDAHSLKQLLQEDGQSPNVRGGASSWVRGAFASHSRTPLHFAAKEGHVSCVRLLLAFGADPNARDGDGYTPLHYVCQIHNPSPGRHGDIRLCVESLLGFGADVRSTTAFGQTPLQLARRHRNDVCRRELEEYGRRVSSLLVLSRSAVSALVHEGKLGHVQDLKIPQSLKSFLHFHEVVSKWCSPDKE